MWVSAVASRMRSTCTRSWWTTSLGSLREPRPRRCAALTAALCTHAELTRCPTSLQGTHCSGFQTRLRAMGGRPERGGEPATHLVWETLKLFVCLLLLDTDSCTWTCAERSHCDHACSPSLPFVLLSLCAATSCRLQRSRPHCAVPSTGARSTFVLLLWLPFWAPPEASGTTPSSHGPCVSSRLCYGTYLALPASAEASR